MAVPPPVITISSSSAPSTQAKPPPSTHRLATQSAAEALQGLARNGSPAISSGVKYLDNALAGNNPSASPGFERGKIAEIWGPAGAGKTAVAFQTAVEAIRNGGKVAWVDCATPLGATRLVAVRGIERKGVERPLESFRYLSVSTLSHLLAMVLHPPAGFPMEKTTLLVIDGLNTLVDLDYPRQPFNIGNRSEQQKWQAGRRYAILGSITTALSKLAVLHNLAIIVTTGCSSRMRTDDGLGAAIGPGIGGTEWENGIWSRIVVFRDFNGRFVGVQKCLGRNLIPLDSTGDVRNPIGFEIEEHGLMKERHVEVDFTSSSSAQVGAQQMKNATNSSKPPRKRTFMEIADSEDEDLDEYGWAEKDDDALAAEAMADEQATSTEHQDPT